MTAAPESTYDTLRRISHGDLAAVIRSIPDPIERWEAENSLDVRRANPRPGYQAGYDEGHMQGERRAIDRLSSAIASVDRDLGRKVRSILFGPPEAWADRLRDVLPSQTRAAG